MTSNLCSTYRSYFLPFLLSGECYHFVPGDRMIYDLHFDHQPCWPLHVYDQVVTVPLE